MKGPRAQDKARSSLSAARLLKRAKCAIFSSEEKAPGRLEQRVPCAERAPEVGRRKCTTKGFACVQGIQPPLLPLRLHQQLVVVGDFGPPFAVILRSPPQPPTQIWHLVVDPWRLVLGRRDDVFVRHCAKLHLVRWRCGVLVKQSEGRALTRVATINECRTLCYWPFVFNLPSRSAAFSCRSCAGVATPQVDTSIPECCPAVFAFGIFAF